MYSEKSLQVLGDLKVLDLTQYVAGPACTKLLADFGADVVKIERPGLGDGARHNAPFLHDSPHSETSGFFLYLNNNKKSITLNLKSQSGVKIFKELVRWADAVVENYRPSVMDALGLGYEILEAINPRIVMTSISNFGHTGPYKEYEASEAVYYAMSGVMYSSGMPDREPVKMGANVIQFQAGVMGAFHTLLALDNLEARGRGEHVDLSIHQVQTGAIDRGTSMLMAYQHTGLIAQRGYQFRHGGAPIHHCQDGYLNMYPEERLILKGLEMIGRPELKSDPRFSTTQARSARENLEAFDTFLTPWLLEHSTVESWSAAQQARIMSGPVYTTAQLVEDPNFNARGFWSKVERPFVGETSVPGRPFIVYPAPWSLRRPAPTLGEHNHEVYGGLLGYSRADLVKLKECGAI